MFPSPCFFLPTVVAHGGTYLDILASFMWSTLDYSDRSPPIHWPPPWLPFVQQDLSFLHSVLAKTPVPEAKRPGSRGSHSTAPTTGGCPLYVQNWTALYPTWLLLFTINSQIRSPPTPLPLSRAKAIIISVPFPVTSPFRRHN